jgi:ribosomal protein L19
VNRLSRDLCSFAGCVLNRTNQLIGSTFVRQPIVASYSAESLFDFAG